MKREGAHVAGQRAARARLAAPSGVNGVRPPACRQDERQRGRRADPQSLMEERENESKKREGERASVAA